ncbi:hypothetical protein pb186bvf_001669 [Paramecium bursaria]
MMIIIHCQIDREFFKTSKQKLILFHHGGYWMNFQFLFISEECSQFQYSLCLFKKNAVSDIINKNNPLYICYLNLLSNIDNQKILMNIDCLFLECFLCKKPPYKARQCTSCQIILCYKCLLPKIGIFNICPVCQTKLVCQPINKISQMLLEQMKVYCKYCKTKMSSFAIRKHVKQCKIKYKIKNSINKESLLFSHIKISKCQVCLNQYLQLDQCKYCQKLICFSCLTQNLQLSQCFNLTFQPNSEDFVCQMQKQLIFCPTCSLQLNYFELSNHFQTCQEMEIFCANNKCKMIMQRNQFSSHILACTNLNVKNLNQELHLMNKVYSLHQFSLLQLKVEEKYYSSLFDNILGFQTRNQIQETAQLMNFQ